MTHTMQAVAWTLIHFCWQAAAIAVAYRLLSWATACRASHIRYLVALSALLLMLGSAAVTFAWELRDNRSYAPAFAIPAFTISDTAAAPAQSTFPRTTAPGFASSPAAAEHRSVVDLLPWIDGLWILGVVALSLRSLGGWWLIQRLRSAATVHAPAAAIASFQRIAAAMGIRRQVLLRVSAEIAGPITVGAMRAIVLLPLCAATSLSTDELEVVIAHELAHIRRADFFWNLLQTLAETLFFFHPAVWWISARIRHERELCCDDLALQVCPNPVVYARALYQLEQQRSRAWRLAMALDGNQSPQTLRMRISRILGEPVPQMNNRPARPLSFAAACAALIVLVLPVPQLLASLNPLQQSAPVVASTPAPGALAPHSVLDSHPVIAVSGAKLPVPSPHRVLRAAAAPSPDPAGAAQAQSGDNKAASPQPHTSYIDQMKAAGYDVDLDKYMAMKIQNVTPEYARAMAAAGFGKPSADDLVACKIHGVTPEYIAQLKQQGFEVNSIEDAIAYRIFQVSPEYAAAMRAAGFTGLTSKQMIAMRVQGITPDYASEIKKKFPNATAEDLIKTRIFRIDSAFIAEAEKHGFKDLSLEKLVRLRISGLFDDEAVKP